MENRFYSVIFTVLISNERFRIWYEVLNNSVAHYGVKIKEDCVRIEALLEKSRSNVKSKCGKLVGRARGQYLSGIRGIAIRQDKVVKVEIIEPELKQVRGSKQKLLEENEQLQRRCEDLYTELQTALQNKTSIEKKLETVENNFEEATNHNKELREYIKSIGVSENPINSGKVLNSVGSRQQRRSLKNYVRLSQYKNSLVSSYNTNLIVTK